MEKKSIIDRNLVREYLLGRLDEQTEIEGRISDNIFFNDEMTDVVDSVEDEIIEEYLEGSLAPADKLAVDQYFLQAPERKEKLRFARLLKRHFETQPAHAVIAESRNLGNSPVTWTTYFRTYVPLVALVLVSFSSLIYITAIRRNQARLQEELAQEREHAVSLLNQTAQLQAPMVPLTLVADRSRGTGPRIPQIQISPSTRRIIVEIALPAGASGSYDVRLETGDGKRPLWSSRLLPLISTAGDARLVFDLPTEGLSSDVYSFAVSSATSSTSGARHYDFQTKVAK